jgi:hypothetical protein
VRHQREAHSSNATISTAVHKDIRSINSLAAICKPRTGSKRAAGKAHPTDKLTDPRPAAKARAKTEFATQGETPIEEETLFVDEVPTAAKASERRRYREFELDELASANKSPTENEMISDDQVFKNAANRILEEKQGDGRTFYLIRGTVTVNMNLHRSWAMKKRQEY